MGLTAVFIKTLSSLNPSIDAFLFKISLYAKVVKTYTPIFSSQSQTNSITQLQSTSFLIRA